MHSRHTHTRGNVSNGSKTDRQTQNKYTTIIIKRRKNVYSCTFHRNDCLQAGRQIHRHTLTFFFYHFKSFFVLSVDFLILLFLFCVVGFFYNSSPSCVEGLDSSASEPTSSSSASSVGVLSGFDFSSDSLFLRSASSFFRSASSCSSFIFFS